MLSGEGGEEIGEGKKSRCQDFEKLPEFPLFGPTTGPATTPGASRLGTPALFNLYSVVIFAILFTPFGILVTAHSRHELLFDERVDQGIAVGMSPISAPNSLFAYHTSLFAV